MAAFSTVMLALTVGDCARKSATRPAKESLIEPSLDSRLAVRSLGFHKWLRALTIGCDRRWPWASTAPIPLLRRQRPGRPEDGGAEAEGTKTEFYKVCIVHKDKVSRSNVSTNYMSLTASKSSYSCGPNSATMSANSFAKRIRVLLSLLRWCC